MWTLPVGLGHGIGQITLERGGKGVAPWVWVVLVEVNPTRPIHLVGVGSDVEPLVKLSPRVDPLDQLWIARVKGVCLKRVAHGRTSLGRTIGQWTTSPEADTRAIRRLWEA